MTEKAEEARRVKEEFVASVSHELRTPLNMIIGYTDLIIKSPRAYGKALPSRLLADIASIQRNSEHLVDLINDVLDLSQIDAGHMALNPGWVSIQQMIRGSYYRHPAAIPIQTALPEPGSASRGSHGVLRRHPHSRSGAEPAE